MTASASTISLRDATVCHVISGDLWGGAEAQALGLMQGLSEHAHVCAIVFNRDKLYASIEQSGMPVDLSDEQALGFAALISRTRSILKQRRPDIVHVHGFKENLVAGIAARLLGIPVVRTHHGRGMVGVKRRYSHIERLNAALLTDSTIAVSEELAKFLRARGLPLRNLQIIRNGIDSGSGHHQAPSTKSSDGPQARPFTVGTVGRLVTVKNHKCLLDAFKITCERIDPARLIIVGDGPLAGPLAEHAAKLGMTDKVVFAGFRPDVSDCLSSLDVFVLSSFHEGIPMSLLEAMSMDIPVVCTRVGGIPEVITDQYNGLLADSNDAMSLAAAMTRIASDRGLAQRLAANARATVSGELSFTRCLASTISLYRGMLSK